jgi:beta-lactamase class A
MEDWKKENKDFFEKRYKWKIITFAIILVLFFVFWDSNNLDKNKKTNLINPVLNTKLWDVIMDSKTINLESFLIDYRETKIRAWDLTHLSVYFRNMNNGNRFGIDEKEMFSPASLMKLPLLIAYLKKSEEEIWFLEKEVVFVIDPSTYEYKQNFKPEGRLKAGKKYKIIDILKSMIKYSDNEASIFLENNIEFDYFMKVFTDIWIEFPPFVEWTFDNNIRIVDYSAFFRVLYNSSYLNKKNSQLALDLLTKTEFKEWLYAWVSDTDISIAHKFGERSIVWNNWVERMQLHDCGIIYYPDYPYLLCIMTRWYHWETLKNTLQEVSNVVYEKVNEAYSD